MSLTRTVNRTGEVTEALIIMLRTLAPAVTDVGHVQTDSGATAAVETRADGRVALVLVFVIRAVKHIVAANIQGQAVVRTWQ